jgi:Pyruvate/2-oxoacid:ferredoxin oxidoreductase delta subunit
VKIKPYLLALTTITAIVLLSAGSVRLWGDKPEEVEKGPIVILSDTLTVGQIAELNEIPLRPIFAALDLSEGEAEHTLARLRISPDVAVSRITKAMVQYSEHQSKNWFKIAVKFGFWFLLLPIPLILLAKKKLTPGRRKLLYVLAVAIFGVALGADPSPMGTVKDAVYLLAGHGTVFWPRIIALGAFLLIVVIGHKFICSWGCQFGVLQDFLFRLNRNKQDRRGILRQYKIPFRASNTIRVSVFVLFTLVAVSWTFDFIGYIDPFKIFHPTAMTIAGIVFLALLLITSLFVYRPWCHLACPFGLVSWFFERLSVFRVKVDYQACTGCRICAYACPSQAMRGVLLKRKMPPDCFACGVCIEQCPTDAVSFSVSRKATVPNDDAARKLRKLEHTTTAAG